VVFIFSRSGDTILLGVSNYLISFIGSSTKSFNLGVVVYSIFKVELLEVRLTIYKINSSLDSSLRRGSSRLIV
jgi:hypothetical protein